MVGEHLWLGFHFSPHLKHSPFALLLAFKADNMSSAPLDLGESIVFLSSNWGMEDLPMDLVEYDECLRDSAEYLLSDEVGLVLLNSLLKLSCKASSCKRAREVAESKSYGL